jgi:hypothetical protein
VKHFAAKVFHERLCLKVEIAQHFIRAPAAQQLDVTGVHIGTKEGGGAGSTEASGRDIGWEETKARTDDGDSQPKCMGNVSR